MMEFIFIALGFILLGFGLLGCFLYKIPGPILSFLGILVLQFGTDIEPFSIQTLIICAIAVVVCKILEKQAPKLIAKIHSFGKGGKIGCMVGSFIGIILLTYTTGIDSEFLIITIGILGLLGIPFILSILGEFISNKDFSLALKSGTAAWINYLVNTLLQLAVSVYCIYTAFNSL
ncbi:MAG: DUF456 domain-containing protein [Bacteroides sp.]|nr:DUF456 domain-containing protein [Bacteroides sp.]